MQKAGKRRREKKEKRRPSDGIACLQTHTLIRTHINHRPVSRPGERKLSLSPQQVRKTGERERITRGRVKVMTVIVLADEKTDERIGRRVAAGQRVKCQMPGVIQAARHSHTQCESLSHT